MNDHAPKYISVYNQLKTDILSGKYPAGGFLPPESELMEQFDASRTTIRRAIGLLKDDQLLHVQQGRGSEVLSLGEWPPAFSSQEPVRTYSQFSLSANFLVEGEAQTKTQNSIVDIMQAEIKVAKALQIPIGTRVFRLQRVHMVNDIIFAYVVSYIPCTTTPGLEEYSGKINEGYYEFFYEKYNIKISAFEDTLCAVLAGFLESQLLNIAVGSALLVRKRISFQGTQPIEYSERYNRPDIYELKMKTGVPENRLPLRVEPETR